MIKFRPMPTDEARHLQNGGADAYGLPPERAVSDGLGNPCRHCLRYIAEGAEMLIVAHRPFPAAQPYAETGPVFLCAEPCEAWTGEGVPPILRREGEDRLVKGYSGDDRIVYGLGKVVPAAGVSGYAATVLADERVAYVHIRSSTNNCYTCRVDRA